MSDERSELLALADRCEREEPSRELDAAIARALGIQGKRRNIYRRGHYVGGKPVVLRVVEDFPAFSSSLDAAVTLVQGPVGQQVGWFVGSDCRAAVYWSPTIPNSYEGTAKTPALALCAAALRARAIADRGDT